MARVDIATARAFGIVVIFPVLSYLTDGGVVLLLNASQLQNEVVERAGA
jgi:hypothetical protein